MFEERSLLNVKQAEGLIRSCGLSVNYDVDYTVGIFDDDVLVATGSLSGDMIQMLAVSSDYQGKDLTAIVITHLINYACLVKKSNLYLFTKPEKIKMFVPLGFNIVAVAKPYAALLELGSGITEYRSRIKEAAGEFN